MVSSLPLPSKSSAGLQRLLWNAVVFMPSHTSPHLSNSDPPPKKKNHDLPRQTAHRTPPALVPLHQKNGSGDILVAIAALSNKMEIMSIKETVAKIPPESSRKIQKFAWPDGFK